MQREWNYSSQNYRPENGHSTKELEHRLTDLEASREESRADRKDLFEISEQHREKLSLHERLLLGILIALAAALQDKFPKIAALLKGLT
jgi:hypothetical protein